jgi:spermidine synthase
LFTLACYVMFFFSGAAALIYQVAWVRSLTLIFGGSHLAVTAVLSIFMAGLAVGAYFIGRYADSVTKLLRLYGLLEFGIALFALVFMALMRVYPSLYIFLAQGKDDSQLYLLLVRMLFAVAALIIPTSLMGGTLPLLTKFLSKQPDRVRRRLSFLYALNTFGAVVGSIAAGFFLLKYYSVSLTLYTAFFINVFVGCTAFILQSKAKKTMDIEDGTGPENTGRVRARDDAGLSSEFSLQVKLILWGIGVSGFCALGYEVLWTRILSIIVGANVYSFTVVLAAFLSGIALGSEVYGILPKVFGEVDSGIRKSILMFGSVEIIIGISGLAVSSYIIYLPAMIVRLEAFFSKAGIDIFGVRALSGFALAFFFMSIPAFFMGAAFPLAGKTYAEYRERIGTAVGGVFAFNTAGAILGASASGFLLIYFLGIERSLEVLAAINICLGLLVFIGLKKSKALTFSALCIGFAAAIFLIAGRDGFRIWDTNYFAVYQSTHPENFDTPEKIRASLTRVNILYYAEGVESIVSSFRIEGGNQIFMTNGRVEASLERPDVENQLALGHLPMLLNKAPENILVIGTGSGMTLGATSIYKGVEKITLVEIEPKVIGIAKSFGDYNHHVMDNPLLRIVFNDGRNFLMTSREKYDVITADPIHPWFRGAGYLYSSEYFNIASRHLRPGGIVCQWLPLYDLTVKDVKTIARTFAGSFKYTMLWLTSVDAQLVGSNSPIILDPAALSKKLADPDIFADLNYIGMGTAKEFLDHFVMGNTGMEMFGRDGALNTDDNLYLEFSAPLSFANPGNIGLNRNEILKYRKDITSNPALRTSQDR